MELPEKLSQTQHKTCKRSAHVLFTRILREHNGCEISRSVLIAARRRDSHVVPNTMKPRSLTGGSQDTTHRQKSTDPHRKTSCSFVFSRSRAGPGAFKGGKAPPCVHRHTGVRPPRGDRSSGGHESFTPASKPRRLPAIRPT